MAARPTTRRNDPARKPLGAYKTLPGSSDEILDAEGEIRPVWRDFLEHFGQLAPESLARRFAYGDQHLRDAGVFYRQYSATGSTERAWPLSHVPVIIHEAEWRAIEAGLMQRADLLEAVAADLYGENRLVADGHLPASLIAASPEWLRPLVGVTPASGRYLHFVAFEIGRGPGGDWWVLGDRTQAPSGAGFALENRVAASRAFADYFAYANVRPLSSFFRDFRDALLGLQPDRETGAAILTPGPLNDTFFEHAYIARHLGFGLVEGEDLAVADGRVMVRTVSGLKPISVIWRRIDASYADPLELDEASRLGAPGLIGAIRRGGLTLVNALGSGVLETRALMAFLPRICEALRSEPLQLPNIATWWCGQPAERAHVEANAERMLIGSALSTALPFDPNNGARLGGGDPAALTAQLEAEGALLVGQEAVSLSTTPAFADGRLRPRPMTLRVFLAWTPNGWKVMPGGYARIGGSVDASAVAMQSGGSVADVWIIGDTQNQEAPEADVPPRPFAGALPSRSADNLFWLGRYVERAEGMIRLLRAHQLRLTDSPVRNAPLPSFLRGYIRYTGLESERGVPRTLKATIDAAVENGGRVRDRISVDAWLALSDLAETADKASSATRLGDSAAVETLNTLLRKITGFAGLVHENMYRFTDWRFLTIGRCLERASTMASVLARFAAPDAPAGALDVAVEVGDSVMTHRRRYASSPSRVTTIELLVFDTMNPRSIQHQLNEARNQIAELPDAENHGVMGPPLRAALLAQNSLAVSSPETLDTHALTTLREELGLLSDLLTDAYLR